VCSSDLVCGEEYGEILDHMYYTETGWKKDADKHWKECSCGDKSREVPHEDYDGNGRCDVCEYLIREVNVTPPAVNTPTGNAPSGNTPSGNAPSVNDPVADKGLGAGAIFAIVIGSVAGVSAIGAVVYVFVFKKKK